MSIGDLEQEESLRRAVRRVARSEPVHLHRCAYVARMRPAPSDFLRGARASEAGDSRETKTEIARRSSASSPSRHPDLARLVCVDRRRVGDRETFHNTRHTTVVCRIEFKFFATRDISCAISSNIFRTTLETYL